MSWTVQYEQVAQSVASGSTWRAAVREAYPDQVQTWSRRQFDNRIASISAKRSIRDRVAELQTALAEKRLWTRTQSVQRLIKIVDDEDARAADVISAIKLLNDMHGFVAPTRVEHAGEITVITRRIIDPLTPQDITDAVLVDQGAV